MPSFDTVSELDGHEVTNALDQANRELSQRFDFKDSGAEFTREPKEPFVLVMKAKAEFQLRQMLDILQLRLSKRGIDVSCLDIKDPEVNLAEARQKVILKQGIDADAAALMTGSLLFGLSMQLLLDPQMDLEPIRETSLGTLRASFAA